MSESITVTGNVVTDPEQRVVRGDDKVTSFRIAATRRRFDDQTGRWVDVYTNYYSVSAFRVLGLNAFAALKRGQRVIVTGKLRIKDWDNGTRQGTSAEIDADGIGHDLLFGVTTLERSGSPAPARVENEGDPRPAEASATPADAAALAPAADAWHVVPVGEGAVGGGATDDVPF